VDLLTLAGLIIAFASVFLANWLGGGEVVLLLNLPSAIIVIVGSLGAALAQSTLSESVAALRMLSWSLFPPAFDLSGNRRTINLLAHKARRFSIIALENDIKALNNDFAIRAMQMAVDGADPELLSERLHDEAERIREKRGHCIGFLESGTKAQKNRAAVSGGGAKPWAQKGTGRARAGTSRSPIWVGGGRAFPGHNRDFSQKVNRKMYRGALQCIMSELVRQDRLVVVDEFTVGEPKTKAVAAKLKELDLTNVLIVTDSVDENLYLGSRNLPKVDVRDADGVDPVSLIAFEKVLVTVPALKKLEEALA